METENTRKCTKTQAELAEQASSYILDHMDKRITIVEIAQRMHVSQTQLKNSFRNYYGNSVYKYIRSRKMQLAAVQLAEEHLSVMEIAGMLGLRTGTVKNILSLLLSKTGCISRAQLAHYAADRHLAD